MNQKTIAAGKFFLKSGLILVTCLVMAVNQLTAQQKLSVAPSPTPLTTTNHWPM